MSALTWVKTLLEATTLAKAQGKKILLIGGRANCAVTVWTRDTECELANPPIRPLIDKYLVPWFCDPDVNPEGEQYLIGTGQYYFPQIAIIDPADTSKVVSQTTGRKDPGVLFDWLKNVLNVDIPRPPELDKTRLMADFIARVASIVYKAPPVPWCEGTLSKPRVVFGTPYVVFIDASGKKVNNLESIRTWDVFSQKLYLPFPNVKKVMDATYMPGVPPAEPPPVDPPVTEYGRLSALVAQVADANTRKCLDWLAKKAYGIAPEG